MPKTTDVQHPLPLVRALSPGLIVVSPRPVERHYYDYVQILSVQAGPTAREGEVLLASCEFGTVHVDLATFRERFGLYRALVDGKIGATVAEMLPLGKDDAAEVEELMGSM
jgi:hypothetical protein